MSQLAFFPWLTLERDIDAGEYSLKRFVHGRLPSGDPEFQETLEAVLAPYRDLRGKPIKAAAILTRQGRDLLDDLSEEGRADLFLFAELFAFAALATRDFFTDNYLHRDQLRLVIQAFSDPQRGVLMGFRRRDGSIDSYVTGDIYQVRLPAHVNVRRIKPDVD